MSVRISYSIAPDVAIEQAVEKIRQEVEARSYQVANELRNSAFHVMRGKGGGRRYKVPGTKTYYSASAPGEPPAVRSGAYRLSLKPTALKSGDVYTSRLESDIFYAYWLEHGTPGGQMAPRPHHKQILDRTEPIAVRIYSAPYD